MRPGLALASTVFLAALVQSTPGLATPGQSVFDFRQPAQPLPDALLAISERTGAVVLAPAQLTAGKSAPAVRGRMTLRAALSAALANTRLEYVIGADGVVTLVPARVDDAPLARRSTEIPAPEAIREPPSEVASVRVVAAPRLARPADLERRTPSPIELRTEDQIARSGALTLGDAMRDLPGTAAVADGGETRQVTIRGLASRFTRVRINGMETLATFGGANVGGGTNRGRAFDYNVFAADLFKQIRLQKTASADVDEGSLGSTVDLRTRSPFETPDRSAMVYVEQTYNSRAERWTPRGSIVLSRRLADDRLGVILSAAYSHRYALDAGSTAGGWQSGDALYPGFGAVTGGPSLNDVNAALHARIPRVELMTASQSRLGLTGTLDWRPDDATRLSLDVLYARLDSKRDEFLLESFTFRTAGACGLAAPPSCGLNAVTAVSPTLTSPRPGLSVLIASAFNNVDVKSEARHDELNTVFRQFTLFARRALPGGMEATALAGFSRSDFSNPIQRTLHLDQTGVDGFTYDFRDSAKPSIGFGDANLIEASAWSVTEMRDDPNWVDNVFKALGADISGPLGAFEWRAGALHKDYRTRAVTWSRSNGSIANINGVLPVPLTSIPIARYGHLVGAGVRFGVVTPPGVWLTPDVRQSFTLLDQACAQTFCDGLRLGPEPAAAVNYAVRELDDAAYIQLARQPIAGRRLWGDFGLRLARTGQDSSSLQVQNDGSLSTVRARRSYSDLLPSANLVWTFSDDLSLRLGAARVMARPDLPDLRSLRPGFALSTISVKAVSSGNPNLKATRARNLDASLDWYGLTGMAMSLAVYHKSIASIVQQSATAPAPFSANPYGLPDSVATLACGGAPGCDPALPIWQFIRPINTGPAKLYGAELSASVPIGNTDTGPSNWKLQGSIAYTRSKVRYRLPSGEDAVIEDALGGPRRVGALWLVHESPRWDGRIGVNHRGRYLTVAPSLYGGDSEGASALTTMEASLRYKVSDLITLTLQGSNLTDSAGRQFVDRGQIANYQHRTGLDVRVGVRFHGR